MEPEANQIRASILDMAHCIRTFTEEISDYSRKLVGIVQHIEGGEQIVEDGIGMAHTEHVWFFFLLPLSPCFLFFIFSPSTKYLMSNYNLLVLHQSLESFLKVPVFKEVIHHGTERVLNVVTILWRRSTGCFGITKRAMIYGGQRNP